MATRKAIVVVEEKQKAQIRDIPIPKPGDEWVLVKTKAVGLNPTDWKHVYNGYADAGSISGCDYAGIVEEVGSKVTKFKKGDRIAGIVHGGNRVNHDTGAFSEYVIAKAAVAIHIPENLSFEEAATLGVATVTVGQGLYKSLKLPFPTEPAKEPFPILIHGGSTGMGIYGIQFAKLSGLRVIATSSPHNFEYVKSLGAEKVFDYRSPTVSEDIRAYTDNKLKYAWDCVGGEGPKICAAALTDQEVSYYGSITSSVADEIKEINPKVDGVRWTLGYDAIGDEFRWFGEPRVPEADELDFASKFWELTRDLLAKGAVKPSNIDINRKGSGLEGVLEGMEELRENRVSATKLVYTL